MGRCLHQPSCLFQSPLSHSAGFDIVVVNGLAVNEQYLTSGNPGNRCVFL